MNFVLTLIKIVLTVLLIFFSLKGINFNGMKSSILSIMGMQMTAACTLLVFLQTLVAGYRLKPIMQLFDYNLSGRYGIGLWFLGNFFSQFLISFIGGDTMRVVGLNKAGVRYGTAMRAIFLDRVVGFVSLQILFIMGLPFLIPMITEQSVLYIVIVLASISSLMILSFFGMGLLPLDLSTNKLIIKLLDISAMSRFLYLSKNLTLKIMLLSLGVHICTFVAIYILTNSFGGEITIMQALWIGAPVVLLAMLPISIGGWGVRESAMIIGLGLIGVSPEIALLVSIIIGLSFVVGSLPGGLLLLKKKVEQATPLKMSVDIANS